MKYLFDSNNYSNFEWNKMPISIHGKMTPFIKKEINLSGNECIYLFTDGFADQFGGPDNKKFLCKNLKKILLENHMKTMSEQKKQIINAFHDWKKDHEQIDDVMVLGLRI